MTAVSGQLAEFPTGARVATSSPDGRAGEETHYAETTGLTASEAMGRPRVWVGPFGPGGFDRSPVWLVVVTGTRTYEDIASYLSAAAGQVVPSGNTVEFAFDAHRDLVMTTATAEGSGPSVLSYPGIGFLLVRPPLPAPTAPGGELTSLDRQGHVAVGSCPGATTEMTVTANTLTISQHQWVVFTSVLKNLADRACRFIGSSAPGGALSKQEMGPCGMTSIEVLSSSGSLIWPVGTYMCPSLQPLVLRPGRSVEAQGDWYGGQAPPGGYTIVVAQNFAFKVTVE